MNMNNQSKQVVVVGGGVLGLSICHELAKTGVEIKHVFPRAGDIETASGAAGAMLGAFGEVTRDDGPEEIKELEFRLAAQRMYPEWLSEIKSATGQDIFQGMGTYIAANLDGVRDRDSINRMKAEADRLGEPASWVEPNEVPGLNPSPNHAAVKCLHLPNEHSVDSHQLLNALNDANARNANYQYIDDSVLSVMPNGDNWKVVTNKDIEIVVDQVIIAAGSRTNTVLPEEIVKEAGIPDIYFGKGISALVSCGPTIPQTIRTPNRAFACGIHAVPRGNKDLLYIGATNFMGNDHDKERGMQPGELHALFDDLIHQINTDIRVSRIEEFRIGYRPIASHRKPVIGSTKLNGLFIATGTYRNGVLMAPLISKIIVQELGLADTQFDNPFPVIPVDENHYEQKFGDLSSVGIRDIVSFLQEPRGSLPYNRAEQLEIYMRTLFEMSVFENTKHDVLRERIRHRLKSTPFNETMHQLFYEIIESVDAE